MTVPSEDRLIHDWAELGDQPPARPKLAMLDDETLRDGLQSPSVIDPPTEVKVKILHLMDSFGVETADVGLPGAGPRQRESVERLCREIGESKLQIKANCAARTLIVDIQPIAQPDKVGFIMIYGGHVLSGDLLARDDVSEVCWFAANEIPWEALAFQSTCQVLRRWRDSLAS